MKLLCVVAVWLGLVACSVSLSPRSDFRQRYFAVPVRADADLCAQRAESQAYCTKEENKADCTEEAVALWLKDYDTQAQEKSFIEQSAAWDYMTNITAETMAHSTEVSSEITNWFVQKLVEALRYPPKNYNATSAAQLTRITTTNALCDSKNISRLVYLNSLLSEYYSTIEACFYDNVINRCLIGQAQFASEMSVQEDYDVLLSLFERYYNGAIMFRSEFAERVDLLNQGARLNNWPDNGVYEWKADVGDDDFIDKMVKLLDEINPLYLELHAYVRHKLHQHYGDKVGLRSPIPMHLTRNMYGQTWGDLIGWMRPYPDVPDTDITEALQDQGYNTDKIFRLSEDFFASIGCANMTDVFWQKSMLEQPEGRVVECHGSAWDMQAKDDYRIKMCTTPTMTDFTTVHHEMGHIEYFMAYRHQPYIYRDGAQSGFHEAIGDTITLSVLTPEHLKTVGLLTSTPNSTEYDMNVLMTTALDKIPFFSFAIMMDLWRWKTFNGSIKSDRYNREWWKMRLEMGGLVPPAELNRNNEAYFDPGAKYHVTNNVPYIRYFMSFFLQFQFYDSMCKLAGHDGPLHRCDFYRSEAAGQKLWEMMSNGKSTNWHDQLEFMTGSREISSASILKYFKPLHDWLKDYNDRNNLYRGWEITPTEPNRGVSSKQGTAGLISVLLLVLASFRIFAH